MSSVIVASKPLDDRFKGLSKSITVGDEVMPIPPDEYGNGFDGGMMPSGVERYVEQLIDDQWHQETLPMSYTDAIGALGKRLNKKYKNETPQVGEEVVNEEGNFAYVILPATMGMILR